jgi:hypothetical protein
MFRNRKGVLRNIFAETRILLDIQSAVKAVVSADIHVAALHEGELHLITQSASIATRIKYSQKSILGALKAERLSAQVKSIKVSVRPQTHDLYENSPHPPRDAIAPNWENGRQIKSAADHIDDLGLKSALLKLSERANSQKED